MNDRPDCEKFSTQIGVDKVIVGRNDDFRSGAGGGLLDPRAQKTATRVITGYIGDYYPGSPGFKALADHFTDKDGAGICRLGRSAIPANIRFYSHCLALANKSFDTADRIKRRPKSLNMIVVSCEGYLREQWVAGNFKRTRLDN